MELRKARQKLALHWRRRVLSRFVRDDAPQDTPLALMIPVAPKDLDRARVSIPLIRARVAHPVTRTVIVAPEDPGLRRLGEEIGAEFLPEEAPLAAMLGDALPTTHGWIKQQFLKLGGPGLLGEENVLVMDADTYPLRPVAFTDGPRHVLYCGDPNRERFRDFTTALLGPHPAQPANFIAHCMLFHGPWLDEMLAGIEARHGVPWPQAILRLVADRSVGRMSEYDLYGCFLARTRPDRIARPYYAGIKVSPPEFRGERPLPAWKRRFRFVSNHERPEHAGPLTGAPPAGLSAP